MASNYANILGIIEVLISIPFFIDFVNPNPQLYKWNDCVGRFHITIHSSEKKPIPPCHSDTKVSLVVLFHIPFDTHMVLILII